MSYNGYKNAATYYVGLLLDNERRVYDRMREILEDTRSAPAAAPQLRRMVQDALAGRNRLLTPSEREGWRETLRDHRLNLSDVDWEELARFELEPGTGILTREDWGLSRERPRGEYSATGRRVYFKPGQTHTITVPYSEAAMHLRLAGRTVPVRLLPGGRMAQLHDEQGRRYSIPVTPGEAGILRDDQGRWYGVREVPEIEMGRAIRRMGDIHQRAVADREWDRQLAEWDRTAGRARSRALAYDARGMARTRAPHRTSTKRGGLLAAVAVVGGGGLLLALTANSGSGTTPVPTGCNPKCGTCQKCVNGTCQAQVCPTGKVCVNNKCVKPTSGTSTSTTAGTRTTTPIRTHTTRTRVRQPVSGTASGYVAIGSRHRR